MIECSHQRHHVAGIKRLFGPEDVINIQILRSKLHLLSNRNALTSFGIDVFVVPVLHSNADLYLTSDFLNQRIADISDATAARLDKQSV